VRVITALQAGKSAKTEKAQKTPQAGLVASLVAIVVIGSQGC
jgi:hypothetical protein